MAWFYFRQNNSGGFFQRDDNLCEYMFVEAPNHFEANKIAENLGCYWDGVAHGFDCSCCGDRWNPQTASDEMAFPIKWENNITINSVEDYAKVLAEQFFLIGCIRIFYQSGAKKEFHKVS